MQLFEWGTGPPGGFTARWTGDDVHQHSCSVRQLRVSAKLTLSWLAAQTTNLLLQAGEEALHTDPERIAGLAPLRCPRPSDGATSVGLDDSAELRFVARPCGSRSLLHWLQDWGPLRGQ